MSQEVVSYEVLREKKQALEEQLKLKLYLLKSLCLQEAGIIGELPPETPLDNRSRQPLCVPPPPINMASRPLPPPPSPSCSSSSSRNSPKSVRSSIIRTPISITISTSSVNSVPTTPVPKLPPRAPKVWSETDLDSIPVKVERKQNQLRPPPKPLSPSIPVSPTISPNANGVEVNIVSVGHVKPYWEETKPYELSDFFKYSKKHRSKASMDAN